MDLNAITLAAMTDKALVGVFVRTQCQRAEGLEVTKEALHAAYRTWAGRRGKDHPMSMATFGRYLLRSFPEVRSARLRVEGGRVWHFVGIAPNEY